MNISLLFFSFLGAEDLSRHLGSPFSMASPLPSSWTLDRHDKVRYLAFFSDSTARSVQETLRMVAAFKMVDDDKGSMLAPADWESNQVTITNTKAGVPKFYQEKYTEKKQGGFLAPLKKKLYFYL